MSIDYGSPVHADGFTPEGSVTPDNLFDRFAVRRKITIPSGQGPLMRGTALGKITASGKWVKSLADAEDGSEIIRAILLHDVDATSADVDAIVGRVGRCNGNAVIFGAGHTLAGVEDACIDRGIIFEAIVGA